MENLILFWSIFLTKFNLLCRVLSSIIILFWKWAYLNFRSLSIGFAVSWDKPLEAPICLRGYILLRFWAFVITLRILWGAFWGSVRGEYGFLLWSPPWRNSLVYLSADRFGILPNLYIEDAERNPASHRTLALIFWVMVLVMKNTLFLVKKIWGFLFFD